MRGIDHMFGANDMHGVIGAAAKLTIDASAVGHRIAPDKGIPQHAWIGKSGSDQADARRPQDIRRPGTPVDTAGDDDYLVALLSKRHGQMTPDESGTTGNRDSHGCLVVKQIARDDLALDLRSALVDPGGADLAVEMLEEVAAFQRDRAMNLDRGIDHLLRRLGGEEFRHR